MNKKKKKKELDRIRLGDLGKWAPLDKYNPRSFSKSTKSFRHSQEARENTNSHLYQDLVSIRGFGMFVNKAKCSTINR